LFTYHIHIESREKEDNSGVDKESDDCNHTNLIEQNHIEPRKHRESRGEQSLKSRRPSSEHSLASAITLEQRDEVRKAPRLVFTARSSSG
jgi:hypothetical protein